MSPTIFRFSDISNNASYSSSQQGIIGEPTKRKGCWVGVGAIVGIVVAAAVVATVVGLLVFYLHPDRTKDDGEDAMPETTASQCEDCTTETTYPASFYRLPASLIPHLYEATLRPDFYGTNKSEFMTTGSVNIHFEVVNPTKEIVLHMKSLIVDEGSIKLRDGVVEIGTMSPKYEMLREFYTIPLASDLKAGKNYTVYMEFKGELKADLTGIYLSEYKDENDMDKYMATSHLQPTEARKVFPCFDEPALKARIKVTLERKADQYSYSNAGVKTENNIGGGWVADVYEETPIMSTYLLACMVSEFICLNDTTTTGTMVFVCSRPEYIAQAEWANSIATEMQEYYERYHAVIYPLSQMVHMAVPDFSAGAMENWGLIFYRETALLFDEASSAAYNRQRVTIVVAHELAHQWFGNLVTPAWWDDIWLNEGFASYMETICTHDSFNDWDMDGQLVVDDMQSVFGIDSLVTSHPIYQPVSDPAQINELFDSIAYSKGASIIRMMHFFLGEDVFRWGISDYLKDRKYQAAHHLELFTALTKSAQERGTDDVKKINVTEVMQTWLLQMGYPVITVQYNKDTGDVSLAQNHFLLDSTKTAPISPYGYQWIVPVSIVNSVTVDFQTSKTTWLNSASGSASTDASADWVICNSLQQYYYRVNYDTAMWTALTNQLITNYTVIHSNNRAQLIDDSFNLARAGITPIETFLSITKYLTNETAYVPWRSTWHNLDYMNRMFQTSGNYDHLRRYVQQQVTPIYMTLGWDDDNGVDTHIKQRHRTITLDLACAYGMADCLENATRLFSDWMEAAEQNETNPIGQNLRSVTYCSAIADGGSTEWAFAWDMYLTAPSSSEKSILLQAMTCTKEVHLLAGYLSRALNLEDIKLQDVRTVITQIAANPVGRSLAWNFVRGNWEHMLAWFKDTSFTLPRLVEGVTQSFSTEWELTELKNFKDSNVGNLYTATRAVDQAIENTEANIQWRSKHEQAVTDWIKEQPSLEPSLTMFETI